MLFIACTKTVLRPARFGLSAWVVPCQLPKQRTKLQHLTDADRVRPEHVAIGKSLFEFGIVSAEALAEAFLPVAAPPHPHEIIGRGECKKHPEQNVVKSTHYLSPIRFPRYFPCFRTMTQCNCQVRWLGLVDSVPLAREFASFLWRIEIRALA